MDEEDNSSLILDLEGREGRFDCVPIDVVEVSHCPLMFLLHIFAVRRKRGGLSKGCKDVSADGFISDY